MKAYIGQAKLIGPLSRYAGKFNFLELGAELGRCPRPAVLRRWREEVSKGFVFSIRMGRAVGAFDSNAEEAIAFGLHAAEALEARWLVVPTPATLGPGQRNRDRLKKLFERLLKSERRVAWDPRGLWGEEEVLPLISEVDVQWARDPSRYEMVEEPIAYGRIPALGVASRVGLGLAERAADALRGFEEIYLVIEGDGAGRAAQIIREALSEDPLPEGEGDDSLEELTLSPRGARPGGSHLASSRRPTGDASADEDLGGEDSGGQDLEGESHDDEDLDDEDLDDEDLDDEDLDDEDLDDEDLDDRDPDRGSDADDDSEDLERDSDEDVDGIAKPDPELEKPETIDDSDLPWAPGPKGRRTR